MKSYLATIGLEVHAELNTKSKMFCGCANNPHDAEPNQNACPVCLAHPGSLPTVNKQAVTCLMMMGSAIGGKLADYSEFDRKNYFYPDIPKAYQISQSQYPFVLGGDLCGVAITRVHLEEDTARNVHDQMSGSLVDFNRAGVPLMELVTEPVIHDAKSAGNFARELQLMLRTIGISDANMERGEMRVEANISVSHTDVLGTKVEVKNINSFKAVEAAIDFEIKRHIETLSAGGVITQETRGWDDQKEVTFSQRSKETANDYRYFPDPDIPKFKLSEITEFSLSRINEMLPELADFKREKYKKLGLTSDQIELIISDIDRDTFFNETVVAAMQPTLAKSIANYLLSDVLGYLESTNKSLTDANPTLFAKLIALKASSRINSRVTKDLLPEVVFEGKDPEILAKERNLLQSNSKDDLVNIISEVIANNQSVVAEYKAGKESALQYLVGQGMKASRGSANPTLLHEVLLEILNK